MVNSQDIAERLDELYDTEGLTKREHDELETLGRLNDQGRNLFPHGEWENGIEFTEI